MGKLQDEARNAFATLHGAKPYEYDRLPRVEAAGYWRTVRLLREVLGIDVLNPDTQEVNTHEPGHSHIMIDDIWFSERGGKLIAESGQFEDGEPATRAVASLADLGKFVTDFPPFGWGDFEDDAGNIIRIVGKAKCAAYVAALEAKEAEEDEQRHLAAHEAGSATLQECGPECPVRAAS